MSRFACFLSCLFSLPALTGCGDSEAPSGELNGIEEGPPGNHTGGSHGVTSGGTSTGTTTGSSTGSNTGTVTGSSTGTSTGTTSGGIEPRPSSHVVVVAHQDDDLLFINPDLKRAIDRGEPLLTAYLTSGNAGMGMTYVTEREMGIKSAYAFMAGAPNSWTCNPGAFAGKMIQTCQLDAGADVALVFFRLVDGWADGHEPGSLLNLWTGAAASSSAVDASGLRFNRDELIASVTDILRQRDATAVYTTDFTFEHRQNDHSDHEMAAMLTLAASSSFELPHSLLSYQTYTTQGEAPNLSPLDQATVEDTFSHYASCDSELGCSGGSTCDQSVCSVSSELYRSWFSRHYWFERLSTNQTTRLESRGSPGTCLTENGGSIGLGACGGMWIWGENYSLQTPSGLCLTAGAITSSTTLSAQACDGGPRQRWALLSTGQVLFAGAPGENDTSYELGQCLNSSSVSLSDCGTSASVEWNH